MDNAVLLRISKWGKIVGIIMFIYGLISTIAGLFIFIVGAIPGLLSMYLAHLLFETGKKADEYLDSELDYKLYDMLDNFGKYLLITGILLIIDIAFTLLALII